jgi:hypothetical protein
VQRSSIQVLSFGGSNSYWNLNVLCFGFIAEFLRHNYIASVSHGLGKLCSKNRKLTQKQLKVVVLYPKQDEKYKNLRKDDNKN